MRTTITLAGLVLIVAPLTAQTTAPVPVPVAPAAEVSPELKAFNGYWKPESVIADGTEQMTSLEAKASIVLRIRDGEYTLFAIKDAKADTGLRLCTAQLAVDPAAKTFVLTVTDGYRKGERMHGIYDLAGPRMRVCYGPESGPRPTTFDAPKGSHLFCETWVSEKN